MDSTLCPNHPNQPLMLFCIDDKSKLCLKCVAKHAGHTILDFEDVCKSVIQPQITTLKELAMIKLDSLNSDIEEIIKQKEELIQTSQQKNATIKKNIEDIISMIDTFG